MNTLIRPVGILWAVLGLIVLAACGGGGGGSTPDTTPPTVSSVSPAIGTTDVAVNSSIAATLSENMTAGSFTTASFTLSGGAGVVIGAVSYNGSTATFNPTADLAYATTYTATISTGVTDAAGNALAANYVWSFTTGAAPDLTPPIVSGTSPANNATNAAINADITVTFSENMTAGSFTTASFTLSSGAGVVIGAVSYNGTTATFDPTADLAYATTYTATITTGATDAGGNPLETNYVWTFTTGAAPDTTPPTVFSISPATGASNVAINADITGTFSENMTAGSLTTATFTLSGGAGVVPGTVSYSGTTATFNPTVDLAYATTYTATITTGVTDAAGNALAANYTWTFTTPLPLSFTNGQAAAVVVGQPDFITGDSGGGAARLSGPFASVHVADDKLYVPDDFNDRLLVFPGIPSSNGASAAYALGQPDLTTVGGNGVSAIALNGPGSAVVSGGRLFVSEFSNHRVSIYNTLPTGAPGTIDVVLGQGDKITGAPGGCVAGGMQTPEAVWVVGGKIIVPDGEHHRVLIWNSVPTVDGVPADLVLGQADMTSCSANRGAAAAANSLNLPSAVWSDGTRLVVADTVNSRVLIWNNFPTSNGQAADLVLGQADFVSVDPNRGGVTAAANTMQYPQLGVFVLNNQLFVADAYNNRVLVWNSFPTSNGQAADAVIGQANFTSIAPGTTASTLNRPVGIFAVGSQLFVTDALNNRVMIYND
jgi:methionine-rich copper-binding protein CopC